MMNVCPFCKKAFKHISKHKCKIKREIEKYPNQKNVFGEKQIDAFKDSFGKWLEIEKSHIRKEEEKLENSVYTYWEVNGKKLRAFNKDKHECFLKADIPEFIKMKEKSFETLWSRMLKGRFKTIDYEYFKNGLHYIKMRRDEAISTFNLKVEIISPRGDEYVYFITRVGLKIMLLHTNQEYPVYIAHRLFELEYATERNNLYQKEVFPITHEPVKMLEYLNYKKYKKSVKCDPNEIYVDIMGNKVDSKGEGNIGTVCAMLELLTGEKLGYSHPDVIKLTSKEREYYKSIFDRKLLSIAGWGVDITGKDNFPYQLEPDFGFKQFPDYVFEFFGWHGPKYEARRKIKEYIYQDKKKKLVAIEKDQDSNLPFLMERIIKGLNLRKRTNWKAKLKV